MKNEPIARYSSSLNKVSGVSTVREVSKMLKQGRIACTTTLATAKELRSTSSCSFAPWGEGDRRPDEGSYQCDKTDMTPHQVRTKLARRSLSPTILSRKGRGINRTDLPTKTATTKEGTCSLNSDTDLTSLKRAAFTLAEVLITLAVIGIVAALTIPSLVQSYKERQYVSQLKKTYSVLQNAFQMAIAEHGTLDQWGLSRTVTGTDEDGNNILDYSSAQLIFSYIEPYLNIVSYDLMNKSTRLYSLDGRYRETTPAVPSEDNKDLPSGGTLSDGSYFLIGWISSANCSWWGDKCGDFWIYLPDKKMQLGVTQFNFYLTKNGLFPRGYTNDPEYTFEADCDINNKAGKSSDCQGRGCAAWVLYQGNMNYLHCDDLSWSGKKKCD